MASMEEAAKIMDVAARHAYVFDNGLSSPDFFDVEKRMASEEFRLIVDRCEKQHHILEIGCFTGLNLLGLAKLGFEVLYGKDFVEGAIKWLKAEAEKQSGFSKEYKDGNPIVAFHGTFDPERTSNHWDRIVCFDVLEHQQNVGQFLDGVARCLGVGGKVLFLVPKDSFYSDCGHVAWFPDVTCFQNVLNYHFDIEECFELKTCQKLFACCKRRD